MEIRSLTPDDIESADNLLQSAFGSLESRKTDLERYMQLQPEGWFGALEEEKLVGMVGSINYNDFAYIGLMGVHPDYQRQKIGQKLMAEVMNWIQSNNCPIILLDATEAGFPLYKNLGFAELNQTLQYGYQGSNDSHELTLSKWVSPLEERELPQLVELDTPVFGANRERVFELYFHDLRDRCFVTHDENGLIAGFIFAQSNRIGPWIASTVDDAESLLTMALNINYNMDPIVLTPAENQLAQDLLTRAGFSLMRSTTHMQYGEGNHPQHRESIWGLTSFAIG